MPQRGEPQLFGGVLHPCMGTEVAEHSWSLTPRFLLPAESPRAPAPPQRVLPGSLLGGCTEAAMTGLNFLTNRIGTGELEGPQLPRGKDAPEIPGA